MNKMKQIDILSYLPNLFTYLLSFLRIITQISIGYLEYSLGQLEYQRSTEGGPGGSEYWIMGVAVGGGILLTIIIIILVVYKRKSTRAERQFKKLQMQLDSLESNIRNECKQGRLISARGRL